MSDASERLWMDPGAATVPLPGDGPIWMVTRGVLVGSSMSGSPGAARSWKSTPDVRSRETGRWVVVTTIPMGETDGPWPPVAPDRLIRPATSASDWRAAVDVESVTKRFGSTLALDNVSLSVEPGRVLALLGPNGA